MSKLVQRLHTLTLSYVPLPPFLSHLSLIASKSSKSGTPAGISAWHKPTKLSRSRVLSNCFLMIPRKIVIENLYFILAIFVYIIIQVGNCISIRSYYINYHRTF